MSTLDKKTDGLDDKDMRRAIAESTKTNYVTVHQLAAATKNVVSKGSLKATFALGVLVGIVCFFTLQSAPVAFVAGLIATLVAAIVFMVLSSRASVTSELALVATQRYIAANPHPKVLVRAGQVRTMLQDDMGDDHVDGIIVVSRDVLVDLLVLNKLHAEAKVLVVSESGYPQKLKERVDQALIEQPNLPIHVLHDVEPAHDNMAARIAKTSTFDFEGRQIIDLGFAAEGQLISAFRGDLRFVDQMEWQFLSRMILAAYERKTDMSELPTEVLVAASSQ